MQLLWQRTCCFMLFLMVQSLGGLPIKRGTIARPARWYPHAAATYSYLQRKPSDEDGKHPKKQKKQSLTEAK